ncbi:hypothetical protein P8452_08088 [Trifolium repens]|nr:hypothetical protein P8452_08088 [Trifolium repens]
MHLPSPFLHGRSFLQSLVFWLPLKVVDVWSKPEFSKAPGELDTSDFPSFHSMSTQLCHDHSYLVFINENNYNSSELVLSRPFGHFLMAESTKSEFKLWGPLGHIISCKLLIDLEFKLGEGWTTFCQLNNIQPGNRLTFNMHETLENNVIIVKQM